MREPELVSTIMTKNVVGLTRSDSLERANVLFNRFKIKHIPVVSGESIIGLLSFTDLMRISQVEAPDTFNGKTINTIVQNTYTIEQVMAKDIVTITTDTTIKEAAKILSNREFHALPIVENGTLVGIITTRDLLKYLVKQL
ncbi:CBS domain-containing protein [Algibacter sp. 2305UL17-15]|uniref:CBS domain-containing protein n=1 Tax=Algibacter sp. 2305UL17-15 TaxID=3231268 RepID=UPI00345ADDE0